jgi:UDP-3-O-acyl-N-acetylglucosamine deacetylase
MSPPEQIHMFLDNFWKSVGERLNSLTYFDEVIIEHLHAYVGKSELDEMYLSVNNPEVAGGDGKKYHEYMNNKFDNDVNKLKAALKIE